MIQTNVLIFTWVMKKTKIPTATARSFPRLADTTASCPDHDHASRVRTTDHDHAKKPTACRPSAKELLEFLGARYPFLANGNSSRRAEWFKTGLYTINSRRLDDLLTKSEVAGGVPGHWSSEPHRSNGHNVGKIHGVRLRNLTTSRCHPIQRDHIAYTHTIPPAQPTKTTQNFSKRGTEINFFSSTESSLLVTARPPTAL